LFDYCLETIQFVLGRFKKKVWENIEIKRRRSRWFIELERIKIAGFQKQNGKKKIQDK
jgi:hypothetical protein